MKWQHFLRLKFTLCLSQEEFDAALKNIKALGESREYLGGCAVGMTHNYLEGGSRPVSIVCVDMSVTDDQDVISTLLHESVHVWQYFMEWMEEEKPGQEIEAYSIQHIFETLREMYQRSKK